MLELPNVFVTSFFTSYFSHDKESSSLKTIDIMHSGPIGL